MLRSTVFPGVTALVEKMIVGLGVSIEVAFCPERIAEGKAMTELFELPQIVSARSPQGMDRAVKLFSLLTESVVELSPEEAELAKLFTNVWRYIKFAAANQFYMMANDRGLDFERIRKGLSQDYPRAADMPGAGFAAGPCLFKDTMQLAAFNHNNFALGHTAMTINEGLPLYLVHRLEQKYDLSSMTVGILGMAFKGESDDIRSSLSYKLKRILEFKADAVLDRRPVRHRRPPAAPAGGGHRPVRPAGDRHPAPAVPRPGDGQAGGRHLERPRVGCARMTGDLPRVSVVIPAYNEGEHILPVLDRIFEAVHLPCEVLVVVDAPEDTTVPVVDEYSLKEPRLRCLVNTYGRGPANAIRFGIDVGGRAGRGRDDGRRLRRPPADRRPGPAGRPRRRGRRRLPLHARRPAGRRAGAEGPDVEDRGPVAPAPRAHRDQGRHQLV